MPERQGAPAGHEARLVVVIDHDGPIGQLGEWSVPQHTIGRTGEARTAAEPLRSETMVQLHRAEGSPEPIRARDRVLVRAVVDPPAGRARTVSRGECNRVVEEEQRGPGADVGDRLPPVAEGQRTRDPVIALMMADDLTGTVDQTSSVAGEEAARVDGVQITPRVDPVPVRGHAASWKMRPRACRRPERTVLRPCRSGAADHPRAERTGRSRVVKTTA